MTSRSPTAAALHRLSAAWSLLISVDLAPLCSSCFSLRSMPCFGDTVSCHSLHIRRVGNRCGIGKETLQETLRYHMGREGTRREEEEEEEEEVRTCSTRAKEDQEEDEAGSR